MDLDTHLNAELFSVLCFPSKFWVTAINDCQATDFVCIIDCMKDLLGIEEYVGPEKYLISDFW